MDYRSSPPASRSSRKSVYLYILLYDLSIDLLYSFAFYDRRRDPPPPVYISSEDEQMESDEYVMLPTLVFFYFFSSS